MANTALDFHSLQPAVLVNGPSLSTSLYCLLLTMELAAYELDHLRRELEYLQEGRHQTGRDQPSPLRRPRCYCRPSLSAHSSTLDNSLFMTTE